MMRQLPIVSLSLTLFAVGCAGPAAPVVRPYRASTDTFDDSRAVAASALVFTPPVALGEPPIELARDIRQPSAFIGFASPTIETFDVETYDRQTSGWGWDGGGRYGGGGLGDRYERRAYIEKSGSLQR